MEKIHDEEIWGAAMLGPGWGPDSNKLLKVSVA